MNMKMTKPIIFSFVLLLVLSKISFAGYDRLFDQFGNVSCKDEMVRLDNLVTFAKESPDEIIYIFVYAGKYDRRGIAEARLTRIKNYLVNRRGLDINRIRFEVGGYREDFTVAVYLLPPSATPPIATPTISPEEVKFREGKIKESDLRCAGN
jgi:hypothetical protein